ncbi:BQ5605_C020g09092 [Microbotryum silenes-dioicae]|uniref:BQ5605_C020g09092 protein n=1 Tax=Microbotryum silenes-dioicae TaxID=796604 RepID=A0A2X0MJQ9_9BASI|nr:BQ5605_C020g09092 [Microbotryum silenes-dioicae]
MSELDRIELEEVAGGNQRSTADALSEVSRKDDLQLDRWDGMTATSQPARPATLEQSGLARASWTVLDWVGL